MRHLSLSRRGRRAAPLVVALALALSGRYAVRACAPFVQSWILGKDALVLDGPTTRFEDEVKRLIPGGSAAFPALIAGDGAVRQTAAADQADLEEALASLPAPRRQALLDAHRRLRVALSRHAEAVADWQRKTTGWGAEADPPPPPLRDGGELAIPAGLPGEFADYLEGAVAYHEGRLDAARAAWERLLARPAAERRRRSTWAAFMLGRTALGGLPGAPAMVKADPAAAARWFARSRELAAQGFADRLGLAAASLGWEAKAQRALGRYDLALKLYRDQQQSGDPTAYNSLRMTCRAAEKAGPQALRAVAGNTEARRILASYILSSWNWDDQPLADDPIARDFLQAVQEAEVRDVAGADRLAWLAYRAGDFTAAAEWLAHAPEDSPLARWLHAKLLLREGKLAEAETLLATLGRTFPAGELSPQQALDQAYAFEAPLFTRERARGESGAIRAAQRSYLQALDQLLAGGYWLDAAYLGERVLTLAELKAYVDRRWAAPPPAGFKPEGTGGANGGLAAPSRDEVAYRLRYLLARRLADAGRYDEARPYYPEELRPRLDALRQARQTGAGGGPAGERWHALLRAACITRQEGLELLGTEVEPDWLFFEGQIEPGDVLAQRAARETNKLLPASADERQRNTLQQVEPWKRFHYRYGAAELARQAAALLTDGQEGKAEILATAGSWLAQRDPKAADPFYKALVACCSQTAIGKAAAEKRWFPEGGPNACGPQAEKKED